MESKINYTIVGIFVVVLGAAFIVLFFWLSAFRNEKVYSTYLVYVKEDVTGLAVQSPVRFNGVPVGFVQSIGLDKNNQQLVKLTLKIQQNTPITTSTVATLIFQGITGVLYVGLKSKTVDAPLLKVTSGQPYPVIPWQPSLLVQLSQVLPQITKNIQSIGDNINKVFSEENQKSIQNTLSNLSNFTNVLSKNSKQLDSTIQSLQHTMKNASTASNQLPKLMDEMNTSLKALKSTSLHVNQMTKSFKGLANKSNVAIENFANQVVPSAQQALSNFNNITINLKSLTGELQRNPSVLLRGKTPTQPGPGEQQR